MLGGDLLREDLGGGEDLDRSLVLQDVALRAGQHLQDLVLDLLQLLLVVRPLHDQLVLLLLQLGLLLRRQDAQQLVLNIKHVLILLDALVKVTCKPSGVIMKLRRVTFTAISGGN